MPFEWFKVCINKVRLLALKREVFKYSNMHLTNNTRRNRISSPRRNANMIHYSVNQSSLDGKFPTPMLPIKGLGWLPEFQYGFRKQRRRARWKSARTQQTETDKLANLARQTMVSEDFIQGLIAQIKVQRSISQEKPCDTRPIFKSSYPDETLSTTNPPLSFDPIPFNTMLLIWVG